jgi:hypothetical protein
VMPGHRKVRNPKTSAAIPRSYSTHQWSASACSITAPASGPGPG